MEAQTIKKPRDASNSPLLDFEGIKALARDDMRAVDLEIKAELTSDVALINELAAHLINSGGKRLRPLIVVLTTRALGYQGQAHTKLAAIIEFIHTATLLHDDVVDASELRRGRATANTIWGNEASVLVGDFLYSRAFEMMVSLNNMRVMEVLAHTTNNIARGEVLQLLNCNDPDTTEARYLDVIRSKTAKLFEASTQLAAVISGQGAPVEQALADFGIHLGIAFQLVDDALDYGGNNPGLGKNVGDDLAEGKPTLPLIHALAHGTATQQALIREAIVQGGRERIEEVMAAIESTGSIAYTAARAKDEAECALKALSRALSSLPESPYRHALQSLVRFSVDRQY